MIQSLKLLPALALLFTIGCAGGAVAPFTDVSLKHDLDQATLDRYLSEMAAYAKSSAEPGGQDAHAGHQMMMMTLESKNWWPLGLLIYWERGSVKMMHMPEGVNYMVSKATGLGPLALLYAGSEQATYGPTGVRESYMAMDSVLWGMPFMAHAMGSRLDTGEWMQHDSISLYHHLLNIGEDHGGASVALFSVPNPVGIGQ